MGFVHRGRIKRLKAENLRSLIGRSLKECIIGYSQGMEDSGDRGERRKFKILEIQMKTGILR